ncbi:MAG: hypothetical protein V9E88_10540 [Ferruginibacter sp.]
MINSAVANGSLEIISTHSFAEIIHNPQTGQKSLHAMIPFSKDDVISKFEAGEICSEPNYLTVQTGLTYTYHFKANLSFNTSTIVAVRMFFLIPARWN